MVTSNKLTKAQIISALAEGSALDKRSVSALFDALTVLVKTQLGDGGPGEIVIPGLVKLKTKSTPATQDREGFHPISKKPMTVKGKPASRKVRSTPIKALKDLVA